MAKLVVHQQAHDRDEARHTKGDKAERPGEQQRRKQSKLPQRNSEDAAILHPAAAVAIQRRTGMILLGNQDASPLISGGFWTATLPERLEYRFMADVAQIELLAPREVAERSRIATAANRLRYAVFGSLRIGAEDLLRILEAVPSSVSTALGNRVYCFVPLTLSNRGEAELESDREGTTQIAAGYSSDLADRATCHRDVRLGETDFTFISSRLMQDRFALAFELFINIGHQYVDIVGVPREFTDLAWAQAKADVRGETSLDAYEHRRRSMGDSAASWQHQPRTRATDTLDAPDEPSEAAGDSEARQSFFEAAFADALAIYMLSLAMDLDYADLREREYPLLAAPALAARLRVLAALFPPGPGYEFAIRFRRRA